MKILLIALSSIAGTLFMSLYMALIGKLRGREKTMDVPKILGSMLLNEKGPGNKPSASPKARLTGIIAHYSVGILFALIYLLLWHFGIGKPDMKWALIFGFVSGIFGIMVWRVFIALHPHPPDIPLKSYLVHLVIAHVVFAAVTVFVYTEL
jgi:hypothetical protein